ncbi:MAG: PTS sugar transporter subunit IIA [Elusimicrobiota bacterium]
MDLNAEKRIKNFIPICPLLREESVFLAPSRMDKAEIIATAAQRVCGCRGLSAEDIAVRIAERERGICTTLETGLSLPHVRIKGLAQPCAALALIPNGIPEPQEQRITIRLLMLFLSPDTEEFFVRHLQILRSAAVLFNPALINKVAGAISPRQALDYLEAEERKEGRQ